MKRNHRLLTLLLSLALLLGVTGATGAAVASPRQAAGDVAQVALPMAATTVKNPNEDPFYDYTGRRPLRRIKPGTVLKTRKVRLKLSGLPIPVRTVQLLYRTVDEKHRPAVTVTTVIAPLGNTRRIVGYLSFYDALGAKCDPSYTLRGGDAGTKTNNQQATIEAGLVTALAAQGTVVTVPDFEGEGLHWVAGQESGWSTLDAVRATEHYLKADAARTKVGLIGYSGGSIGGEWATELAPRYAPELNLVGTAVGGMAIHLAHNLRYINGSEDWSGVIPAVLVALGRAFGVNMRKYESKYGRKVTRQVRHQCIGSFNGNYPGLRIQKLLKPGYKAFLKIPVVARIVNKLIMGSTPGHPEAPMMMGVGNADGIGDDVMIAKDAAALAREYCRQGVPISFHMYKGAEHTQAGLRFLPAAMLYLQERFLGLKPPSNCGKIPAGNSLAPLKVPHHRFIAVRKG